MQLLKIRYYQLKRDLGNLFFVIIILAFGLSYFFFDHPNQYGYYVTGIVLYILYSFNQSRKDLGFITKHFNKPQLNVVIEYQLALLPFSIPSLLTSYYYCFFILHGAAMLIALLNIKPSSTLKLLFLMKYFKNDFIIIAGIRKNFILLIVFSLLALILSPLKLFPFIALYLVNQIIYGFYNTNEGIQLLRAHELNAKQFLNHIIKRHLIYLAILNAPVLFINSIINMDMIYFNLFFLGYNLLTHSCIIYFKYGNYLPKKQTQNNQLKLIIISLGLFLPYLAVLTVIYFFQSKKEATLNLTYYLDDTINES